MVEVPETVGFPLMLTALDRDSIQGGTSQAITIPGGGGARPLSLAVAHPLDVAMLGGRGGPKTSRKKRFLRLMAWKFEQSAGLANFQGLEA